MERGTIPETLPASWYHDEEHFKRELRCIFGREWQLFGPVASFAQTNSFQTGSVAGYPIVVVRTGSNEFKAYHNVCRHRANTLVLEQSGTLKAGIVSCGYHGWSYALADGSLKSAPLFDGVPGFSKTAYPLYNVKCEAWAGMVFVNLDPDSCSLADWLSDLAEPVSKYNLETYTNVRSVVFATKNNWKTFVDGYQECYHCALVHDNFRRTYRLAEYRVANASNSSAHSCPRRNLDEAGNRIGGNEHDEGLWLWKYPNIGLSCYPNGCVVMCAEPVAATETRLVVTYRFPPGLPEAEIEELMRFSLQNIREDNQMAEQCQRGLNAGVYQRGPLHPQRENGVIFFHQLVRRSLEREPANAAPGGKAHHAAATAKQTATDKEKLLEPNAGEGCSECPLTVAIDF